MLVLESNCLEYCVSVDDVGVRVDKYLGRVCEALSRSRLQKLISDGQVSCNGSVLVSGSVKTEEGDVYIVTVPEPEKCEPEAENIPLDIVYEDDDVVVINKPAGLVVHPGAGNWSGTLVNALLYHCGSSLSGIGGILRPGIVHRLDKGTSGLIMVAKNDHAHQSLSAQLSDRTLSRVYFALVFGVPLPIKGVVDRPIGRHRHDRLRMSVMSNAPRDARTHYRVLQSFGEACSLVECKLESGRTHQIRVHMEAVGNQVIGDPLYGVQPTALISGFKKSGYDSDIVKKFLSFDRQALHAKEICFVHPTQEKEMHFSCDLPDDFSDLLTFLA